MKLHNANPRRGWIDAIYTAELSDASLLWKVQDILAPYKGVVTVDDTYTLEVDYKLGDTMRRHGEEEKVSELLCRVRRPDDIIPEGWYDTTFLFKASQEDIADIKRQIERVERLGSKQSMGESKASRVVQRMTEAPDELISPPNVVKWRISMYGDSWEADMLKRLARVVKAIGVASNGWLNARGWLLATMNLDTLLGGRKGTLPPEKRAVKVYVDRKYDTGETVCGAIIDADVPEDKLDALKVQLEQIEREGATSRMSESFYRGKALHVSVHGDAEDLRRQVTQIAQMVNLAACGLARMHGWMVSYIVRGAPSAIIGGSSTVRVYIHREYGSGEKVCGGVIDAVMPDDKIAVLKTQLERYERSRAASSMTEGRYASGYRIDYPERVPEEDLTEVDALLEPFDKAGVKTLGALMKRRQSGQDTSWVLLDAPHSPSSVTYFNAGEADIERVKKALERIELRIARTSVSEAVVSSADGRGYEVTSLGTKDDLAAIKDLLRGFDTYGPMRTLDMVQEPNWVSRMTNFISQRPPGTRSSWINLYTPGKMGYTVYFVATPEEIRGVHAQLQRLEREAATKGVTESINVAYGRLGIDLGDKLPVSRAVDLVRPYVHMIRTCHTAGEDVDVESGENRRYGALSQLNNLLKPGELTYVLSVHAGCYGWIGSIYFNADKEEAAKVRAQLDALRREVAAGPMSESQVFGHSVTVNLNDLPLKYATDLIKDHYHILLSIDSEYTDENDAKRLKMPVPYKAVLREKRRRGESLWSLRAVASRNDFLATIYFNATKEQFFEVCKKAERLERMAAHETMMEGFHREEKPDIAVNLPPPTQEDKNPLDKLVSIVADRFHAVNQSKWLPKIRKSGLTRELDALEDLVEPGERTYWMAVGSKDEEGAQWWVGSVYFNATPEEFASVEQRVQQLVRRTARDSVVETVDSGKADLTVTLEQDTHAVCTITHLVSGHHHYVIQPHVGTRENIDRLSMSREPGEQTYWVDVYSGRILGVSGWWLGSVYFNATPEEFEAVKQKIQQLERRSVSQEVKESKAAMLIGKACA